MSETHGCCAHLKVTWRTKPVGNGAVTGWWQCEICPAHFFPVVAIPASTARTDGLSLHKLCHLLNEESKNVMGTHYEQWASGLQRAITLIETGIEGGYVAAKEIASPAAPGSVPQAPESSDKCEHGEYFYNCDICERIPQTNTPNEVARNWDEQCKAINVIGTVTWHCQWKVHNDDSHYFGNPTGEDEPKHSGVPQAEPPKEEKQ